MLAAASAVDSSDRSMYICLGKGVGRHMDRTAAVARLNYMDRTAAVARLSYMDR